MASRPGRMRRGVMDGFGSRCPITLAPMLCVGAHSWTVLRPWLRVAHGAETSCLDQRSHHRLRLHHPVSSHAERAKEALPRGAWERGILAFSRALRPGGTRRLDRLGPQAPCPRETTCHYWSRDGSTVTSRPRRTRRGVMGGFGSRCPILSAEETAGQESLDAGDGRRRT